MRNGERGWDLHSYFKANPMSPGDPFATEKDTWKLVAADIDTQEPGTVALLPPV